MTKKLIRNSFLSIFFLILFYSCQKKQKSEGEVLFQQQCTRCHIAPDIEDLPYDIWKEKILPDMGARMGMSTPGYNPYKGYSYEETMAMMATNTYINTPVISEEKWNTLKDYILSLAPDSLKQNKELPRLNVGLQQFNAKTIKLDDTPGSFITYLKYLPQANKIAIGDIQNQLRMYDFIKDSIQTRVTTSSPITWYNKIDDQEYLTQVGRLNPSEIATGSFSSFSNGKVNIIKDSLHRPVFSLAEDLDMDGDNEFVICEFGHLTGKVSLITKEEDGGYHSSILLSQPGAIRVVAEDMNKDGKKDLVIMTSQGDESITILYQEKSLVFRREKAIRFSPVYGSSWFELLDYDNDGDIDIATVNGDNADKSQVPKPYHGLRIHLNDGNNNFEEAYFYPLNGATRVLARDFDKDGDVDFALIATFPDYEKEPKRSFVYLKNEDPKNFEFKTSTFKAVENARWFLMDAGDMDQDGDLDIILSAFSYSFNPVPEDAEEKWQKNDIDMMLLENNLDPRSK